MNLAAKARTAVRFDDELKALLFAFGGDLPAQKDTVELLNDLAVDFLAKTTLDAAFFARLKGTGLDVDSVLHTQRHDSQKSERVVELLSSFDEIKKLRFLFRDATQAVRLMPTAAESLQAAADKEKAKKVRAAPGTSTSSSQAGNKKKKQKEEAASAPAIAIASSAPAAALAVSFTSPPLQEPSQTEFLM